MGFRYIICSCVLVFSYVNVRCQPRELITTHLSTASFKEFVEMVEKQSRFHFYFDPAETDSLYVSVSLHNRPLYEHLDAIFSGSRFHYAIDIDSNVFITRDVLIRAEWDTPSLSQPGKLADNAYADEPVDDASMFKTHKIYDVGKPNVNDNSRLVKLSGYVKGSNGTGVAGASIAVHGTNSGTITDEKGYYAIALRPGNYQLRITSIGMKPTQRNIRLHSQGQLTIAMAIEVTNLKELVVTAESLSSIRGLQMGTERLDVQSMKYIPSTFGETDVLKAVLTLPGVKTIGEASTGFNVRGGATDQNLILLNESTIFNPFHFFGFFSSFNAESIQDVELYKSIIPSRYGGRLSSVLKVTGQKGDKQSFKGSAGIGVITSRLSVEGPLIKGKTSFVAGMRTTYSDWVFSVLPSKSGYKNTQASFYDVNLTIDHTINAANSLTLYGYMSKDKSNLNTDTAYNYANRNFSLQWNHDFNEHLTATITAGHDHYDYGNHSTSNIPTAYELRFAIDQSTFKAHVAWNKSSRHKVEAGINGIYYSLHPGTLQTNGDGSLIAPKVIETEQAIELALYGEDQFEITNKLSMQAGIRYSFFNYLGPKNVNYYADGFPRADENLQSTVAYKSNESIKTYQGPEWRLATRYLLTNNFSVKAGYSTSRQYIHMLSNTIAIAPTDIWKLSDPNIKPQFSKQFSVGLYANLPSKWEASIEGYAKRIEHYLDYKSGAVLVLNPSVETDVLTTQGKGYGVELMLKKPFGKLNGWLSYTYSRILLRMDDPVAGEQINQGAYYPASYDKPHDFNFTGNYKFSRRVSLSLSTNYSTGRPVTIPIGIFSFGGSQKTLYADRNSYRIPAYFRMDFSVNIEGNHNLRQRLHSSWTFGVYNVTGRKNPYSVYFTSDNGVIKGYKLSIFGSMVPFINYNIRF